MLHGLRSLVLSLAGLLALSGCDGSSFGSSSGDASAAGTASPSNDPVTAGFDTGSALPGTHDTILATPSVAAVTVVVGARRTLSVTFNSSDGRAITGFAMSGTLGSLPAGWSGPSSFTCASVGANGGCVMNLTYAPTVIDSGTLTLRYVFVDDAATPNTVGSLAIPYTATPYDNVIATASPTGPIDALVGSVDQSVEVNFVTDDGNAATHLVVSGSDLSALPAGWSSAVAGLSCAIVSTGSGCHLTLDYAPQTAAQGTLVLNYDYDDDSGAAKTGTLNIPYATVAANRVVATAAPAGQIIAVQKTGGQPVSVTFTTNDGKPAQNLVLTSDLAALPAGWSSASKSFACASISAGNGCTLALIYAPTALASGTLALSYTYTDGSGTATNGLLDVEYAATTNDNVVGSATPSGQIVAVVGKGSQAVAVTFTTDDGRPATALGLVGALTLPSGWTSPDTSFACSGIDADNVCRISLAYTPTAAANGTLNVNYTYSNNAGEPKSGTVAIAYRATTDDNVVGTPSQNSLAVRTGGSTTVSVAFTTDDGNPASALAVTSGLAALPAGWSTTASAFNCASVSAGASCQLTLAYAPTAATTAGALSIGYIYTNDAGIQKSGTVSIPYAATTPYLYVANTASNSVSACPLNIDDSLGACIAVGTGFAFPSGIAIAGEYAYVTNTRGNSISRCMLDSGAALTGCVLASGSVGAPTYIAVNAAGSFAYIDSNTGLDVCPVGSVGLGACAAAAAAHGPLTGIALATDGAHAYSLSSVANPGAPANPSAVVEVCTLSMNGSFNSCLATAATLPEAGAALAIHGNALYVASGASVYVCPINSSATVSSCQVAAAAGNATGLAFIDATAYVSTASATLLACPVNSNGTFGACLARTDPTFDGSAGLAIR